MQIESLDQRPRPPALPLVFTAVGFAGFALFGWFLVALGTIAEEPFAAHGLDLWLLLFAALAAPAGGAAATYASRRWWPFFVGLALSLVPIVLAVLLIVTAPSGPTGAD